MSDRNKKLFVIICITVPFFLYCVYYYGIMIKNAPYKFAEFDHMSIQYGTKDSLMNKYNSKTGDYQYLTSKDSLVKKHLRLTKTDLLYLHRKAALMGFWDFPTDEANNNFKPNGGPKPPRYIIEFAYKRKTKHVVFDESFNGDPKLKDANEQLIKEILRVLNDADDRQGK